MFRKQWKIKIISLFNLFLLLFMSFTALFDTIYRPHCIISTKFYLYLQYFQNKFFSFNKISGIQTDPYKPHIFKSHLVTNKPHIYFFPFIQNLYWPNIKVHNYLLVGCHPCCAFQVDHKYWAFGITSFKHLTGFFRQGPWPTHPFDLNQTQMSINLCLKGISVNDA